jgi:hypothetical protein
VSTFLNPEDDSLSIIDASWPLRAFAAGPFYRYQKNTQAEWLKIISA